MSWYGETLEAFKSVHFICFNAVVDVLNMHLFAVSILISNKEECQKYKV